MAYNWDFAPHNYFKGSYEEQKMIAECTSLVEGHISVQEWLSKYNSIYKVDISYNNLVGIKRPILSLLKEEQWRELAPRLVFRTFRFLEPTVDSMMRWREPKDREHWRAFYLERELSMMKNLDRPRHDFPVIRLDMIGRVPENELIDRMKPWVGLLKSGRL
jgi:hypothetical protein